MQAKCQCRNVKRHTLSCYCLPSDVPSRRAYEQLATYVGWQEQALQLLSLERQYGKDLARDHLWRYDRSPARVSERQQSMDRVFALAMGDRPPTHQPACPQSRPPAHAAVRQRLQELVAALARTDEPRAGPALRVRLYAHKHEQDRGISW
jgi:hypothetical protein